MASANHQEHSSGSLTHIVCAALDRIAILTRSDERFNRYLRMKTGAERQKSLKQSKLEAGMRILNVWLPEKIIEQLKQKFPGPRGGIDWLSAAKAAITQGKDQP